MSKRKNKTTIGKIFGVMVQGAPTFFCPCLPNLCWTHVYFPHTPLRREPKCSLTPVCYGQGEDIICPYLQGPQHFKRLS